MFDHDGIVCMDSLHFLRTGIESAGTICHKHPLQEEARTTIRMQAERRHIRRLKTKTYHEIEHESIVRRIPYKLQPGEEAAEMSAWNISPKGDVYDRGVT